MERNRNFRDNQRNFNSRNSSQFHSSWQAPFQPNQHNSNINPWAVNIPSRVWEGSNTVGQWGRSYYQSDEAWGQNNMDGWRQVSVDNRCGYNDRFNSSRQNNGFTNRDRRKTPYDRFSRNRDRPERDGRFQRLDSDEGQSYNRRSNRSPSPGPVIELSPQEAKIERLINAVQNQPDNIGQVILFQSNNEIPPVLLHNAVHQTKNCKLVIDRDESTGHTKLKLNDTVITEGMYTNKKEAKEACYEMGLEVLKSKCFYIISKSHYEEVSMNDINKPKEEPQQESAMDSSSKAMQMMLKMGWKGKGLGTKEQGEQKSVADKIVENISREGLGNGGKSVLQEVDKILADYARSNKTVTLGFDSGFTKEERAQIHSMAAKYNLKSKSEGGFGSRRITVSKKMSKWVLVRELLSSEGLENQSYILQIPDDFKELWTDEDKEEFN